MAILVYPSAANPSYIVINQEAVTVGVLKPLLAAFATKAIDVLYARINVSAGMDAVLQLLFGATAIHDEGQAVHSAGVSINPYELKSMINGTPNNALNLLSSQSGVLSGILVVRATG